jgi:uncharacterized OB-fold protein
MPPLSRFTMSKAALLLADEPQSERRGHWTAPTCDECGHPVTFGRVLCRRCEQADQAIEQAEH